MQVLDYSAGKPGAAAIKRAGYAGAVRYIGFPNNRKCTSAAELDDFDAHGLGMALVFEETAGQWRNGRVQGERDARIARAHADAIGFPSNRPIYMAIDQDVVSASDFNAMLNYLRGSISVLGLARTGVYGEHDVVKAAAEHLGMTWLWQCRAWSGTPVRKYLARTLYQYFGHPAGGPNPVINGIECDVNEVESADWGQHNATQQIEEEQVYAFDVQELPATGPDPETNEVDIVWPPLEGATGLAEAWVTVFVPAMPDIDPEQPELGEHIVNVQFAHWCDDEGNRVPGDNYIPDHSEVRGGTVLPGQKAPSGAVKLVLVYNSPRPLKATVEVRD